MVTLKRWLISKEETSEHASKIYKCHKELLLELGIYRSFYKVILLLELI